MDSVNSPEASSPYVLLFQAISIIPTSHYIHLLIFLSLVFLYNFFEFHIFEDLVRGFRGRPALLTFNPDSDIYNGVVSKCRILHGRYLATPWLSSPHFQTSFLNFFGNPPLVCYRRQLFRACDGGTLALDWLMNSNDENCFDVNDEITKSVSTPLVVVIPGLTSDSTSAYIKHLAYSITKHGWNVVISNHRGLGGVSVTSDCFYNAGWTEDTREVVTYLHRQFPKAPIFAVGTSIGANILVKYLGEDGENTPLSGAAAICSPWDLLIGDRFIKRKLIQKFYDRVLASGLQYYARLHEPLYTRLADWDGIIKARSVRDFDHYATCHVGKFQTVDTYYRCCSSASFVKNVSVPLLCVNSLDDPVCTSEAVPWDECRANKNIILATTHHGGHLAFFGGITASRLWWVEAVQEFLAFLHQSSYMHKQKKLPSSAVHSGLDTSVDHSPFVDVSQDGRIAPVGIKSNTDNTTESRSRISRCARSAVTGKRQNRMSAWLLAFLAIGASWPLLGAILRFAYRRKKSSLRK